MDAKRRQLFIECAKDILILLLTFSAFYMIGRSHLYKEFQTVVLDSAFRNGVTADEPWKEELTQSGTLQPSRLVVHNRAGRYGVQYDQGAVDALFTSKLGSLLGQALDRAGDRIGISEEVWQTALSAWTPSVYYEFSGNVSLDKLSTRLGDGKTNDKLSGEVRHILLAVGEDGTAVLCYQNQQDGLYYTCALTDAMVSRLKDVASSFAPNDAVFAFESTETLSPLPLYTLILPALPQLSTYGVSNPLEDLNENAREALLRAFSFNPQTAVLYQAVDGFVVREGGDTLRISTTGTVTFHSAQEEQRRYEADTVLSHDTLESTQQILEAALLPYCGEARFCYLGTRYAEDGSATVSFGYELEGVHVYLNGQKEVAKFVFQDGCLIAFFIHFRQYLALDTPSIILPERQAVAAARAMGAEGKELLLCYIDDGGARMSANWMVQGE